VIHVHARNESAATPTAPADFGGLVAVKEAYEKRNSGALHLVTDA
jgi:hypothetical protein